MKNLLIGIVCASNGIKYNITIIKITFYIQITHQWLFACKDFTLQRTVQTVKGIGVKKTAAILSGRGNPNSALPSYSRVSVITVSIT